MMWDYLAGNWIAIATLIVAILGVMVSAGLFVRRTRDIKDLLYVEQERDGLRKRLAQAEVRLNHVDPERFIDAATEAYDKGDFVRVDELSTAFTQRQQEAFGKAAEFLLEQRILDSETQPQAIEDATRFSAIGRALMPDKKRLEELSDLSKRREVDLKKGDPIEALNLKGLTALELHNLSIALIKDGEYALAEVAARRAVPRVTQKYGHQSKEAASVLSQHAGCLNLLAAYPEAEGLFRQVLEIDRVTIGEEHANYAIHLNNLALVLNAQGRFDEAEGLFREALEIGRATIGEAHPDYATSLNNLANVVRGQGRFEEAEGLYREALEIGRATIGEGQPDYAIGLNNLANVVMAQGEFEKAEVLYREVLEIDSATIGDGHPFHANHLNNLANVVRAQGRFEEAEELYREALKVDRATIGERHPQYAGHLINLAGLLRDQGNALEARPLFEQALAILEATLPVDHPDIAIVKNNLANLPPANE